MKEIPFNDFVAKYQAGEINVVDVREQEEYDALHLDGVTLLPLSVLAERYSEHLTSCEIAACEFR